MIKKITFKGSFNKVLKSVNHMREFKTLGEFFKFQNEIIGGINEIKTN